MKKRVLSFVLAFVLTLGMSSTAGYAEMVTNGQLATAATFTPYFGPEYFADKDLTTIITDPNALAVSMDENYPDSKNTLNSDKSVDESEKVFVIVEMKKAPLGEDAAVFSNQPAITGFSVESSSELERVTQLQNSMISEQDAVLSAFAAKTKMRNAPLKIASYTAVFNGFAMEMRLGDVKLLKQDPRVSQVYLSQKYDLPEPQQPDGDVASNGMVGASSAWAAGYDGEGMLIAVIDTGIDYNHPLFSKIDSNEKISKSVMATRIGYSDLNAKIGAGQDSYKNDKVIYGYDYSSLYNGGVGSADPRDNGYHGTHVAGIAAASPDEEGVVIGVAHKAQVMAMKVFPYAYDHVILMAIDDAVKLGADAMNLSLGSHSAFSDYGDYPFSSWDDSLLGSFNYDQLYGAARGAGCLVVGSGGNEGYMGSQAYSLLYNPNVPRPFAANPDYGLTSKSSAEKNSISTASTNSYGIYPYFTTEGGGKIAYNDYGNTPTLDVKFDGQSIEYVPVPGYGIASDFQGVNVTGKIALIQRGAPGAPGPVSVPFTEKIKNAQNAGAIAVIIYDNVVGQFINFDLSTDTTITIPGIFVSLKDGTALKDAGAGKKITFAAGNITSGQDSGIPGGTMSSFSSWGPTGLRIKPDIAAPGGSIYSTVPTWQGSYGILNGTSMASPHVAGGSLLVKQHIVETFRTVTDPGDITQLVDNLLVSTATIVKQSTTSPTTNGVPYPVQVQGGGQMDLAAAVKAKAIVYNTYDHKTKVELYDDVDASEIEVEFKLENLTNKALEFKVGAMVLADNPTAAVLDNIYRFYDSMLSLDITDTYTVAISSSGDSTLTGATPADYQISLASDDTITVTVTLTADADTAEELAEIYTNGYYVDGFVTLTPTESPDYTLSIPYLGFVGDWQDQPIFDKSFYDTPNEQLPIDEWSYYAERNLLAGNYGDDFEALGINPFNGLIAGKDYIAFSPRSASSVGYFDFMAPYLYLMRNARKLNLIVTNGNGQEVRRIEDIYFRKSLIDSNGNDSTYPLFLYGYYHWNGTNDAGLALPEGSYNYKVEAVLDYSKKQQSVTPQSFTLPVYLDNTAPQAEFLYEQGTGADAGKTFVTVSAIDNHKIAMISVFDDNGSRNPNDFTMLTGKFYTFVGDDEESAPKMDITAMVAKYGGLEKAAQHICVVSYDYAGNEGVTYGDIAALIEAVTVTPSGGGKEVDGNIVITFSDNIVTEGNVYLSADGGAYGFALPGGKITAPKVYTIPYAGLKHGTEYTIKITDFSGASPLSRMAVDESNTFTTKVQPDLIPPVVLSATPIGTGVNKHTNKLVITFNKPMDTSLDGTTTAINAGGIVLSDPLWSANDTVLTYTMSALDFDTTYDVLVGGFKNKSGEAAMAADYTSRFKTAKEAVAPTYTVTGPSATGADVSGVIVVEFNKAMDPGAEPVVNLTSDAAGNFSLWGEWSNGNTVLTVLYFKLDENVEYTVTPTGFRDYNGVAATGTEYEFTTRTTLPATPTVSPGTINIKVGEKATFTAYFGDSGGSDYATAATVAENEGANKGAATAVFDVGNTSSPGTEVATVTGVSVGTTSFEVTFANPDNSDKLTTLTGIVTVNVTAAAEGEYDINATSGGYGEATVDKATAKANDTVTLTASEPKTGYTFKRWVSAHVASVNGSTNPNVTFTMPARPVDVRAEFELAKYNVAVSSNNTSFGTATASKVTGANMNDLITLTPNPASGYHFKEWRITSAKPAVISYNQFLMPADNVAITAVFEPNKYNVTVQNDGYGTGATTATGPFDKGSTVTLTATPNDSANYKFKEWVVVNGELTSGSIVNNSFKMPTGNVTLKATFEPNQNALNVLSGGNGTVTKSPNAATAAIGSSVTIMANANSGYHFKEWQVSAGGPLEFTVGSLTAANASFTMPNATVTITAVFEANSPAPTIPAPTTPTTPSTGGGSSSGGSSGSQQTLGDMISSAAKSSSGNVTWQLSGTQQSVTLNSTDIANMSNGGVGVGVKQGIMTLALTSQALVGAGFSGSANVLVSILNMSKSGFDAISSSSQFSTQNTSMLGYVYDVKLSSGSTTAASFGTPLSLTFDVSGFKLNDTDAAKYLTIVRFVDGKVQQHLGDIYDLKTKTISTLVSVPGIYGVMLSTTKQALAMTIDSKSYVLNSANRSMDVAPVIVDGRTLVPVRFFAEAFGAQVGWDEATETVSINLDGQNLSLTIGKRATGMDVPAQLMNGRTMVPLRYISENLGINVIWDETTQSIRAYK